MLFKIKVQDQGNLWDKTKNIGDHSRSSSKGKVDIWGLNVYGSIFN
jgi:hypothetical protein